MSRRLCAFLVSLPLFGLWVSCGSSGGTAPPPPPPPPANAQYVVLAWSELGMHCMDGKDYSVFAVLPPYNTVHAQVLKKGAPPTLVHSGITVTYEAVADTAGSINTGSASKTNFWTYVNILFHANVAPDTGLTGNKTQSTTPQPFIFDSASATWLAQAIPTVPYDDAGASKPYPMAKVVVRDSSNNLLASTTVVLSVSDEMRCSTCHASGSDPAAQPTAGWENDPDPAKDVKWNILRFHDQNVPIASMLPALQAAGYSYQSSLYQTAKAGTPILCAACHKSNALGTTGISPAAPLTSAMHAHHASVVNQSTGVTLDNATSPSDSCYLCHPGATTKCQRGVMRAVACYDCHGNLSAVGDPAREGWLDVPTCQMCHNNGQRYTTTFSSPGVWRTTSDTTFATNPNAPLAGKSLFRFSTGHGNTYCAGCHGSQHAEVATVQPNDNLALTSLQGHDGKLIECAACHTDTAVSNNAGPHGLHSVGQTWVDQHHNYAESNSTQCTACHGSDYKGTFLSQTAATRSFKVESGTKSYPAKTNVSCYDCHDGPGGG
ncbi:MAG: hypothetical protein ROO76_03815 [Terriglobia bacterium]|nr:hypothetical protein [Terriglobia bacterium]